jgi:hypothetical protein
MYSSTARRLATLLCQICSMTDEKQDQRHMKAFGFDSMAGLVTDKWMSNPKRAHLDTAWQQLWECEAQGSLALTNILDWCRVCEFEAFSAETGLRNPADLCIDASGCVHHFSQFCLSQIAVARQKGMRVAPGLIAEVTDVLRTEDPRAWLNAQCSVKKLLPRSLGRTVFFSMWSRSPALDFAQGNHSDICTAFYAPKCDNSDIMFVYLFDPALLCLEIYINFRPAGQIHCVVGQDESTGCRILLVDSFDVHPSWRRIMEQLAPLALKALKKVATWTSADRIWINTKVFTPSAVQFAAVILERAGIKHVVHHEKPSPPGLKIENDEALARRFCRSQPWGIAKNYLHQLGVKVGRSYLDAFGGFVEDEINCQTVHVVEVNLCEVV